METALQALERDGFAVVENALAPDELRALTRAVDRVWAERRPDGGALHELSFLALDDAFLGPLAQPAALRLVIGALGWNVYVYHCHLDVHPPARAVEPAWRWHQDGGRQNVDLDSPRPRLSVKVAYFLTDVLGPEHGAMWVIPGSHRRDRLARPVDGARPRGAAPLLVRAGTAVVFDRRLWHARGDNVSRVTRKALFYGYTYRWIRLRDEVSLSEDRVRRLDPVRRQLVGAATGTLGHWFPTEDEVPLRALSDA